MTSVREYPLFAIQKRNIAQRRAGIFIALIQGDVTRPATKARDIDGLLIPRSEERRVGKECVSTCRSRWSPYHSKKKTKHTKTNIKNHTLKKNTKTIRSHRI